MPALSLLLKALLVLIRKAPRSMTDGQWARFIRALYPLVLQARQVDAGNAMAEFAREAAKYGDSLPPVSQPFYDLKALDDALTRTVRVPLAQNEPLPLVEKAAQAAVERHVQQASRETVLAVAEHPETKPIAWARRLTGAENCGFCVMLASRGPVYLSRYQAQHRGRNQTEFKFHDGCDCEIVPVYDENNWRGRDAYLEAERRWKNATSGVGYKDALNALRRDLYATPFSIPKAA